MEFERIDAKIDDYVIDILQKCLSVPPLAFGANTVEPYKELEYITQKACNICYLYNMYKLNRANLKVYRDDKEMLIEIKQRMSYFSKEIVEKGKELEDFHDKRTREGWA